MNLLSTVVRVLFQSSLIGLFVGQTIGALSQCFVFCIPAFLSKEWFSEEERGVATGFAVGFNILGGAFGYLCSAVLVGSGGGREGLNDCLTAQMVTALVAAVLVVGFVRRDPPRVPVYVEGASYGSAYPSSSQEPSQQRGVLRSLVGDPRFLTVAVAFGLFIGNSYSLATVMASAMAPFAPGTDAIGWLGFSMMLSGGLLTPVFSILAAQKGRFRFWLLLCCSVFTAATLFFGVSVVLRSWGLSIASLMLMAIFGCGLQTLGIEVAVSIAEPVTETYSTGVVMACAQFFGLIFTLMASQTVLWQTWCVTVVLTYAILMMWTAAHLPHQGLYAEI